MWRSRHYLCYLAQNITLPLQQALHSSNSHFLLFIDELFPLCVPHTLQMPRSSVKIFHFDVHVVCYGSHSQSLILHTQFDKFWHVFVCSDHYRLFYLSSVLVPSENHLIHLYTTFFFVGLAPYVCTNISSISLPLLPSFTRNLIFDYCSHSNADIFITAHKQQWTPPSINLLHINSTLLWDAEIPRLWNHTELLYSTALNTKWWQFHEFNCHTLSNKDIWHIKSSIYSKLIQTRCY